ncbi:hypothetical protein J6590_092714 [Homalodisca vitripennis]|nr:hypothetical protein J6590_093597 [Homalodisca vitripennis]KAG8270097.1 hypothetical protein J6590_092714 [Homalodisca vitripennis]
MLSWLPSEMAVEVLRLLPENDLLNAACVSRSWLKICKSDKSIQHSIRRYLRHLRTKSLAAIMVDNSGRNRDGLLSNRPSVMIIKNTFQEYPRFVGNSLDISAVRVLPHYPDLFIRSRKRKSLNDQEVQSLSKRPRLM